MNSLKTFISGIIRGFLLLMIFIIAMGLAILLIGLLLYLLTTHTFFTYIGLGLSFIVGYAFEEVRVSKQRSGFR